MVTDGNSLCGNAKGEIFHRRNGNEENYFRELVDI